MARYFIKYRNYAGKILDQPAMQNILVNGGRLGAWMFSVPSVALSEDRIDAGVLVFQRSLIWLRQRFPHVALTLVYIPSPAAIYRHAGEEVALRDGYLSNFFANLLAVRINGDDRENRAVNQCLLAVLRNIGGRHIDIV
jgi:hypothetical protein